MYDRSHQSGGRRDREPDEVLLVDLRSSFKQDTRAGGLNIKAGQSKRPAHQIHKKKENTDAVFRTDLRIDRCNPPTVNKRDGGDTKRQYISERIKLNSDLGRGSRHPRDAPV